MKILGFICIILILSGCAAMHPVVQLSAHNEYKENKLRIADERPASQKQSELLSSWITSCAYGIARLGDENIKPDRISYLSARLSNEKGEKIKGKQVIIKEFSIYRNNQLNLRGGVMRDSNGIVVTALRISECFADKNHEGGYDLSENPNGENSAIVNISILIGGTPIDSRAIEFALNTPSHFPAAHDVWLISIQKAINKAIDGVIDKI